MKTIKNSLAVLSLSFLAWFLSVKSVLADIAPIRRDDFNKKVEPVDYTLIQYMIMRMEWYHYVIIGTCLVVIIIGGLVSISQAKARKEKEELGIDSK